MLMLALALPALAWAEEKSPEEIVKAAITQVHAGIASTDPAAQKKAVEILLPDAKTMQKLFGDDAKLIVPTMEKFNQEMRDSISEIREEFTKTGAIKKIELTDCRKEKDQTAYKKLFETIPKDIPVFNYHIEYERGASGGGCYVVLDGKARFIKGLESAPEFIAKQKAEKK